MRAGAGGAGALTAAAVARREWGPAERPRCPGPGRPSFSRASRALADPGAPGAGGGGGAGKSPRHRDDRGVRRALQAARGDPRGLGLSAARGMRRAPPSARSTARALGSTWPAPRARASCRVVPVWDGPAGIRAREARAVGGLGTCSIARPAVHPSLHLHLHRPLGLDLYLVFDLHSAALPNRNRGPRWGRVSERWAGGPDSRSQMQMPRRRGGRRRQPVGCRPVLDCLRRGGVSACLFRWPATPKGAPRAERPWSYIYIALSFERALLVPGKAATRACRFLLVCLFWF